MEINRILQEKGMTKYRLSVKSGVPQTTLSDLINGRSKIEKCSGETLYKISKALGVTVEDLIAESVEKNDKERSWEFGLPEYLQHDLDEYKKGVKEKSSLLDCLWGELYSSINIAEINEQCITHEHAQYLRNKYLWR